MPALTRRRALRAGFAPALALLAAAASARAQDFDYYLVALSWTPSWCESAGGDGDSGQCDPARDLGFVLHGLWPQYEQGWPEDCPGTRRDPSRAETAAMADIMGSGGLAWYQWRKHGRCAGLPPEDYFALARRAYRGIVLPEVAGPVTADGLRGAFLRDNPGLAADGLIVTCRDARVREVRICVDRDLGPRACGADVLGDACDRTGPLDMPPVR